MSKKDPADSDHERSERNKPPDPFADLPPPPGSQPTPEPAPEAATNAHARSPEAVADHSPRPSSGEPPPHGYPHVVRDEAPPPAGLRAALRWTVRFFQHERPDLRVVIGGVALLAVLLHVGGLFVVPGVGLASLLYFPVVFVLTNTIIIAAFDAIVGQQRSDLVRLKWAVRRAPMVLAAGCLWQLLVGLGTLLFILPGIYLYVKGMLIWPAAVLEDGLAWRPFNYSKAATRRNNLTVIGLYLVTFTGMALLITLVSSMITSASGAVAGYPLMPIIVLAAGFIMFPLLAPAYTWVYVWNRPKPLQ